MNLPNEETLWLINHRLMAIAMGLYALDLTRYARDPNPPLSMHMHGSVVLEGTMSTFVGPAVEIAMIHGRALLEFLGLQAVKDDFTRLQMRQKPRLSDDIGVEQFSGKLVDLPRALSHYKDGPPAKAEEALALVFWMTNKGLAHSTSKFKRGDATTEKIWLGLVGIPIMMHLTFYGPLGIPFPKFPFDTDPHPEVHPIPWPPSP